MEEGVCGDGRTLWCVGVVSFLGIVSKLSWEGIC